MKGNDFWIFNNVVFNTTHVYISILDFFQVSSAKRFKPIKGLDSPAPRPSTNDPRYATSSSEIGE